MGGDVAQTNLARGLPVSTGTELLGFDRAKARTHWVSLPTRTAGPLHLPSARIHLTQPSLSHHSLPFVRPRGLDPALGKARWGLLVNNARIPTRSWAAKNS